MRKVELACKTINEAVGQYTVWQAKAPAEL